MTKLTCTYTNINPLDLKFTQLRKILIFPFQLAMEKFPSSTYEDLAVPKYQPIRLAHNTNATWRGGMDYAVNTVSIGWLRYNVLDDQCSCADIYFQRLLTLIAYS